MGLLSLISVAAQCAAILLMVWVAWYDVRHYAIRNKIVLAMLALYLVAQGALFFPNWRPDLVAGGILFGIGLVMWLMRGLGAGDAKLMFPLGLHLSYVGLLPFSFLLLIVSVLLFVAIQLAFRLGATSGLGGWLARMKTSRRVPYGLVLAVAAIPVLTLRVIWAS